ncbi:ABC transporter ATP-binding protein, partial [Patulibacter medicamentivorans]|uniref:ATP-binding cassette domain-containing protein n=1 Tax=Patulibacter medicamentivorans TaxID=1097667 RepID=UPI00111034F9
PAAARELRATADAVARVDALLGEAPGRGGTADVAALPAATVVLDGVTVRRGPRTVLRDATLRIGDGERVALVGPSGSGKSTIGELLVDLLPVGAVHGAATIDGRPLDEVDPHVLRRTILHVPQDPYLFDADVRANLRLALPDADDDALRQALRDAGAGAWLDGLRDGLDTPVGERGGHLSGGERQRIGVARALLAGRRPDGGPRLLVLDEPVSQLPPEEGVALLRRLLDADSSRGALLIAHRDAEAALADRCVTVSAQGRLA